MKCKPMFYRCSAALQGEVDAVNPNLDSYCASLGALVCRSSIAFFINEAFLSFCAA